MANLSITSKAIFVSKVETIKCNVNNKNTVVYCMQFSGTSGKQMSKNGAPCFSRIYFVFISSSIKLPRLQQQLLKL